MDGGFGAARLTRCARGDEVPKHETTECPARKDLPLVVSLLLGRLQEDFSPMRRPEKHVSVVYELFVNSEITRKRRLRVIFVSTILGRATEPIRRKVESLQKHASINR